MSETVKMPAMFLDRDIRDRMPKYAENFAFEIGLGPLPFGQIMIPPLFTFKVFDTGAMIDFFYHAEFNRSVEVLVQMAPVPFLIFETSVRDRRCEHFIRVRMAEFNCSIMTRHNINVFWSPDPEFTVALLQNIAILQEKHRKDNYSITPCLELNKKDWCVTQSDRLLLFQAFRGLGNEKHSTIRARYASNWDLVAGFLDSHPVKRGSKIIDFQGGVGDVLKRQMKLISDIKTVLTAQYRPFQ